MTILNRCRAGLRNPSADPERGATAVIVGVLLVALLGMGAYVIDIGAAFQERRDLQNGADAAALALAIDCATNGICSEAAAQPEAERIASLNSDDGQATVAVSDIEFTPAGSPNKVKVTVHTRDAGDGDGEIDFTLAPVLGEDSTAVQATAYASWGGVTSTSALPITFSSCEWDEATAGGTVFGDYRIIKFHDSGPGGGGQCAFGPGQDIDGDGDRNEGGFGYLESTGCSATFQVDGYVRGQPGNGNPGQVLGCDIDDIKGQDLLIPIFDDIPDVGNPCGGPAGEPCFHIYGFAAFHVVDVDMTGGGPGGSSWKNNANICPNADRCIGGYFITFVSLEDAGTGGPSPDLGVNVITLSG